MAEVQLHIGDLAQMNNRIHPVKNDKQSLVDISFKNLSYKVDVPNNKPEGPKKTQRTILNNISGICPGGQLTAILGASGAGKTSLLNIIAKRVSHGSNITLEGSLLANGRPYTSERFASFASLVMQTDILFETLTPREAFQFVANLKYSDHETKVDRVNLSIRALKLERCQHTIVFANHYLQIGGELVKGLSGGEKKRVSIGFELVSDPKVILLDEPTSGLDSFTAFTIMNLMKQIGKELNKTIIFTIHQPSADIYQLFDRIILLVEGKFIYQGSKENLVPYFSDFGFRCPQYSNPMDYMLSIMHAESETNVNNFPIYFSNYQAKLNENIVLISNYRQLNEITDAHTSEIALKETQTSFANQIKEICKRALTNIFRDEMFIKGRIGSGVFMGLLTGGIFWQVASNPDGLRNQQSTSGRTKLVLQKVLFFLSVSHIFGSLNPVMIQFPAERAVFLREENSKLYSAAAYFLGKSSMEIPFLIIIPIVQQLICYWMIGLNSTKYFNILKLRGEIVVINCLIYCLLSLAGNSFGLMGGCMFKDVKVASGVLPMFILPLMLFSGFYQNRGNLMVWISWMEYLSPMKYAFEAVMINQYQNLNAEVAFIFGYRILAYIFLIALKTKIQ